MFNVYEEAFCRKLNQRKINMYKTMTNLTINHVLSLPEKQKKTQYTIFLPGLRKNNTLPYPGANDNC